jgi:hypothetical protein
MQRSLTPLSCDEPEFESADATREGLEFARKWIDADKEELYKTDHRL